MPNEKKQKVWSTKRMDIAKMMPPLRHSIAGEKFDISQSDVVHWLCAQSDIQQLVFNMAKERRYIVYDSDTRMWHGVNYAD